MTYIDSIKDGFKIINRNWQLVLIQVGAMFISIIGFFIFLGIPLAITFIIFGIELTDLSSTDDILNLFKRPSDLLSHYIGLAILLFTSLIIYFLSILGMGVFVFGGSIGSIAKTIKKDEPFKFKTFWTEGKRLFFRLAGFTTIISFSFLIFAFIFGLLGGSISAIISLAKEQEAALAFFLGIFFSLVLFIIGLALIIIVLSIAIYGAAVIALNDEGPLKAIKKAALYLYRRPQGLYLYCLIFVAFLIINLAIIMMGVLLGLVPLVGPILSFIYQLSIYFLQSYLGLMMIATVFIYYHSTSEDVPSIDRDSSPSEDTFLSGDSQQEGFLHQRDETGQT